MTRRMIGTFKVRKLLCEGQAADFYHVSDRDMEDDVLAVVFNPACDLAEYPPEVWRMRFLAAARVLDAIEHPNVARLRRFDRDDHDTPLMIFPLMRRSLKDHLGTDKRSPDALAKLGKSKQPRRLSETETVALLRQILSGLTALHAHGVVHRDLKPASIRLVEPEPTDGSPPTVRILLDGAARFPDLALTGCGVNFGSVDYMAPEQRRDTHDVDERADLYSVGVIAYRMLAGHLPDAVPETLQELRPELSPGLSEWVMDAMAPDRQHRYRSAVTMRAALDDILGLDDDL